MGGLMGRIFDTSRYRGAVAIDRAKMIYGLTIAMGIIMALFVFVQGRVSQIGRTEFQIALVAYYAIGIVALWATRRKIDALSSWLPVAMMYIIALLPAVQGQYKDPEDGMMLAAFILVGGLVNQAPGVWATFAVSVATLLVTSMITGRPAPSNILTFTLLLGGISVGINLFIRYARVNRAEGASLAVAERLKLAELTTSITRRTLQRAGVEQALAEIVEEIRKAYPRLYHVQVFLVDEEGASARLVASTGRIGQELVARRHSLGIGSLSVIGQVTLQGRPLVTRAGDQDSVHRRNELLPETVVEAAFPLRVGEIIIGALDVQSKEDLPFNPDDISTFQSLADSLALAIDNVRQFERAETRIKENLRLIEQSRNALREVERFNERLTGRAWSEFLSQQNSDLGLMVDFGSNSQEPLPTWTNTLADAVRNNNVIQDSGPGRQVVAVPLRVRGQVIGAMEFELGSDSEFTPEDLSLVQEVSERFGLAAENTRLLEESQRIAQREALVNEISTRLQTTNNVEATLAEAARSLRDTLKVNRVSIRLGTPDHNGKPVEDSEA